jgi:hypothetical protein
MKWVVVFLALIVGTSLAQSRVGGPAEISIELRGERQPALIRIETDPSITNLEEMRLWIYRDDDDTRKFASRVVPPLTSGVYELEYPFTKGSWGLNLRYGTGLDIYYAHVSTYLEPSQERTLHFYDTFYGELSKTTPRYMQPLGFSIFALMLLISLTLVVTILRWLNRQQKTVVGRQ